MAVKRHRDEGFTLIEATITVAIVALAAAVAVPSLNNITRANLRASTARLSGIFRQTYDNAALSGQTYRVAFDLKTNKIKIAATEQVLNFDPGASILTTAATQTPDTFGFAAIDAAIASAKANADGEEVDPNAITALMQVDTMTGSKEVANVDAFKTVGTMKLDEGIRILDIWTSVMGEATQEGVAYLYFFPHGYTQEAIVHLEDEEHRVFSIKMDALTGRTRIVGEYLQVPQ